MKIIALEHELPGSSPEAFNSYAKEEARTVWSLYQCGAVREMHFRADDSTAVLELECANSEEAKKLLAGLPFVREGLITFEIIPLKPYPGFERLFEK